MVPWGPLFRTIRVRPTERGLAMDRSTRAAAKKQTSTSELTMPWKTEIDRLVHNLVLDAAPGGSSEVRRATRAIADLSALAPDRPATHFHAGVLEEVLGDNLEQEDVRTQLEELPPPSGEGAERWRHLGRLDGASRGGRRERVRELMEDPLFEGEPRPPRGPHRAARRRSPAAAGGRGRAGLRSLPDAPREGAGGGQPAGRRVPPRGVAPPRRSR